MSLRTVFAPTVVHFTAYKQPRRYVRETRAYTSAPPFSPVRLSSHSTDLEEEKQVVLLYFFFFSLSLSLHAKDSPIFAGILPSQRTSPTNVSRSRTQGLCIHAQWNLTLGKQPALLDRRSCGGRGERVKSKVGSVSHPRSPAKIKNAKQFSGASQQAFKRLSISPHTLCLFSGSWKHPCLFGFLLFFCASTTKYFTGVYFFRGSEYSGGFLHQMLTFCKKGLGTQFTGTT